MSRFMGGSAFSMARDVAAGFINLTDRSFRGMTAGDLNQLAHEIERYMRELRGESNVGVDNAELQARQRKILRLRSALTMTRAVQSRSRGRS